jgi:asparagine N-glycosylation enzyme membrane subunit Stt3
MLKFTRDNLDSTTVVCSWWDYGYWLTMMGDVTTLVDNATINSTQIENAGFIFMSNETLSLKMLKRYNAQYILVFVTLRLVSQSGITWGGFGDEGKWMWMARISGKARGRFLDEGLVDENSGWTNESLFGNYSNTVAQQYGYGWIWNDRGQNSTLYKLMTWGAYNWMAEHGLSYYWPEGTWPTKKPEYFELAYLAGPTSESGYSGYIPLVCLYKIKYPST